MQASLRTSELVLCCCGSLWFDLTCAKRFREKYRMTGNFRETAVVACAWIKQSKIASRTNGEGCRDTSDEYLAGDRKESLFAVAGI